MSRMRGGTPPGASVGSGRRRVIGAAVAGLAGAAVAACAEPAPARPAGTPPAWGYGAADAARSAWAICSTASTLRGLGVR
jgi:hypothetical protein